MLPVNPKYSTENRQDKVISKPRNEQLKLLESTTALSIPEKINILSLCLGHKWVTDVAIDQEDKSAARSILDQLSLPYEENYYEHNDGIHTWLQVAVNRAVLRYVLTNRESLSVLEAGALYGYPVSHSLGYIGMLEKIMKGNDKSISEFYLSGVFSEPYSERESKYFDDVWADIVRCSPVIAHEAEIYYLEHK